MARKRRTPEEIDAPADLFVSRGIPAFVRSGNGPEFVATAVEARITEP